MLLAGGDAFRSPEAVRKGADAILYVDDLCLVHGDSEEVLLTRSEKSGERPRRGGVDVMSPDLMEFRAGCVEGKRVLMPGGSYSLKDASPELVIALIFLETSFASDDSVPDVAEFTVSDPVGSAPAAASAASPVAPLVT